MYIKEYDIFLCEGIFTNLTHKIYNKFGEILYDAQKFVNSIDIHKVFPELVNQKFVKDMSFNDIDDFVKDLQKISNQNISTLSEQVLTENIFQDFMDLKFFKWFSKGKNKAIFVSIIVFIKMFPDLITQKFKIDLGWLTNPINPNEVVAGRGGSGFGLIVVILFLLSAIAFSIWAIKNRDK